MSRSLAKVWRPSIAVAMPAAKAKAKAKAEAKAKPKPTGSGLPLALEFPGEDRKEPFRYGQSVIYFSSGLFRLKEHTSDRKDKAYSYKREDPETVWHRVALRLFHLAQNSASSQGLPG